jgi:PAS domain S-box-containing protein
VIEERRGRHLQVLAEGLGGCRSQEELGCAASRAFEEAPADLPFGLVYLVGADGQATLTARSNGALPAPLCPEAFDMADPQALWSPAGAANDEDFQLREHLEARIQCRIAGRASSEPVDEAVMIPLGNPQTPLGLFVGGVNPRRALDSAYREYYARIAGQLITAIQDIEHYEIERRRAEALTELDRAKTAFFSNISHEFRTPLTLMLGPIEELLADRALSGEQRERLTLLQRNSLRLSKLVNSLLDFARLESGRVQASYEQTDLAAVTRDLASSFRSAMEKAKLEFQVDCENLDESIYVDREMWEKIVLNLLSNALKFTLHGAVTVRLRPDGAGVLLDVIDTGVGIPSHELPHIFQRFHRVEGTEGRTQEGSGIGLALAQELVKLHGGSIAVTSRIGEGSTFRVRLPAGCTHLPPERVKVSRSLVSTPIGAQSFVDEALRWTPGDAEEAAWRLPATPSDRLAAEDARFLKTTGARIVIADDNSDMRAYVSDLLRAAYRVEAVSNGEEALEAARRTRPDLIISDIMMPKLDGLALVKMLRTDERLRDIPVILLSARAGEEARVGGLVAGADDYLVKPFSARELLARVTGLIELTRMRREFENRLRIALSSIRDQFYVLNREWRYTLVNPRALEFTGFAASDLLGHSVFDVFPDVRGTQFEAELKAAAESGRHRRFEYWYPTERRHFEVSIYPTGDGLALLVTDITRRKRDEAILRGQRRIMEKVATGAPLSETLDELMLFLESQEAGARCSLLPLSDDGTHFLRTAAPGIVDRYREMLDGASIEPPYRGAGSESAHRGIDVVVPDVAAEDRYPPEWSELMRTCGFRAVQATPVRGSSGRVLATLVLYYDRPRGSTRATSQLIDTGVHLAAIALERSAAETNQTKARHALELADRQKDEFLAMLAHELRNPLAPIATASELLTRVPSVDARTRSAAGVIKRQAAQLSRLVDDLLDVSRITQGKIELRRRTIDLATIVTQAIETIDTQRREKRQKLTAFSDGPLYVQGDYDRLVQCVGNLLSNAVKYTDPIGEIQIRTRGEEGSAVVEVCDTGAGISAQLLPRVFDLFVQSDQTLDRAQGGLGIGLAVAKRLVEMHGGTIHASSAGDGHGSTFQIRLPRIVEPESQAAEIAPTGGSSRRIFIVDDNEDAADTLAMLLEIDGHTVQVAYRPKDALERMPAFAPDIAFLDIGLPEIDGYELARRLRSMPQFKKLKLVALSGYGQPGDHQQSQEAGFDEHLVKPVDMEALKRTLLVNSH